MTEKQPQEFATMRDLRDAVEDNLIALRSGNDPEAARARTIELSKITQEISERLRTEIRSRRQI